jgi:hypothetical protein
LEELIMPIKTITVAAAAALTSMLALTACGPAATSAQAAKPVKLTNCGSRQARPDIVTVICGSDAIMARTLTWSRWGARVATATGSATVNWCAFEGCAYGEYDTYPIVMIASKIVRCPKGGQQYSEMQYVFVGDDNPFASLPKNFKPTNEFFGSHVPGPAHNQTVDLHC